MSHRRHRDSDTPPIKKRLRGYVTPNQKPPDKPSSQEHLEPPHPIASGPQPISSNPTAPVASSESVVDESDTAESASAENASSLESDDDSDSDSDDDSDYDETSEKELRRITTLKTKSPLAHKNLLMVQKAILQEEPIIMDILTKNLFLEDRARLTQLYEIYKNLTVNTEEWFVFRTKLIKDYKQALHTYEEFDKLPSETKGKIESDINKLSSSRSMSSIQYKIIGLDCSTETRRHIYSRYEEFKELDSSNDEYTKIKNWLSWAVDVPHNRIKSLPFEQEQLTCFLKKVSTNLDKELYGMESVKEQILLFLNSKLCNPNMKKCNLGLIGPPGTGKTSIARLLADLLEFPFEQMSFGGVTDVSFLKGHSYTYIGSQPGEIVKCLKRMNYKNGILFLDEYDKVTKVPEIQAALLHITDPIQNVEFQDNYLSFPIDLSHLWQIYSMNSLPEDGALKDRIFPIVINGYTTKEKIEIVKRHLIPKALSNVGLCSTDITVDKIVIAYLISRVCNQDDKGVRTIEKAITDIVNKLYFIYKHQNKDGKLIGFENINFKLNQPVNFPLTLTKDIVTALTSEQTIQNSSITMMYL
jgi:ATP-dependent Lon protease